MSLYTYLGTLVSVTDGDTVNLQLDLGLDSYRRITVRLAHVNTPEMHDKDEAKRTKAKEAKGFVAHAFATADPTFEVRTLKDQTEKYGRYLAEITLFNGGVRQNSTLNDQLLQAGLAVAYEGGAR